MRKNNNKINIECNVKCIRAYLFTGDAMVEFGGPQLKLPRWEPKHCVEENKEHLALQDNWKPQEAKGRPMGSIDRMASYNEDADPVLRSI